jgi:hypothetical protein
MRSDVVVMKDETVVFHPFAWKSAPSGRPDVRVPLSQRIEAREPLADLMRNYGAPNFTLMIKAGPNLLLSTLGCHARRFPSTQLSFAYPP